MLKKTTVLLAVLSMGAMIGAIVILSNPEVYISTFAAFLGDLYMLSLTKGKPRKIKMGQNPSRKGFPGILIIILVLPLALSVYFGFLGFLGTPLQAVFNTIITVGFSITFFFVSFSIPLAIRHAYVESKVQPDPNYKPRVTILVPAHNEEKVISRSLQSLLKLNYENKEIIVIDDGSIDKTYAIASWYKQFGVKVLKRPNGGKARALNFGLLYSTGEIIAVLDSDTILYPDSVDHIVELMSEGSVYAVGGNVKALNSNTVLERCQELEYITSFNTLRRGLDLFGAINVVPGAFGAFKKEAIISTGLYDPDTVAEDFDLTIKVHKGYGSVRSASDAISLTEVPPTLKNLYRQRFRWVRGTFQVMLKHKDALTVRRYGVLHTIVFPLLLLSYIVPFATFSAIGAGIVMALMGGLINYLKIITIFFLIQILIAYLALSLNNARHSLVIYSPLLVLGYRQFIDAISIYTTLDFIFSKKRMKAEWTKVDRVGGQLPVAHTT
ncbi:MAG: glycosyltransferase family 2 protein [Nitrososphaerales archaeon]